MAAFQVTPPDKFDFSKSEGWHQWCKRFERFRIASNLNEKDQITQVNTLIYCMGEKADEILPSFNLSEAELAQYDTVLSKFRDHFVLRKNIIFERAQFNRRCQGENESVESFITELFTMSEHCEYGNLRDSLIRDRIVVGIKDIKLSEKLQLDANLTLDKAIRLAKQSESVKRQQKVLHEGESSGTQHVVSAVKSKHKKPEQNRNTSGRTSSSTESFKTKSKCNRCGRYGNHKYNKCPAANVTCFKCSKVGHFAKWCKSQSRVSFVDEQDPDSESSSVDTVIESKNYLGVVSTQNVTNKWVAEIEVNKVKVSFKIDTGADVSVIPQSVFKKLKNAKMLKTSKRLFNANGSRLHVNGEVKVKLKYKNKSCSETVYVCKSLQQALLGRPGIGKLGLVSVICNVSEANEYYRSKYPEVFSSKLGTLDGEYCIMLDESVVPFSVSVPRRVQLPLLKRVKKVLCEMEQEGVISKVDIPTEWCAGMVVVPKKNGDIRICTDFTHLNKAVLREKHPLPSVDELLGQISGAKMFTKLDAKSGFWQVKLAEKCKLLTTFVTPCGRFCYNRLPFGISSAPEYFQKRMCELLNGMEGVVCAMDDILIHGSSKEIHDKRLKCVLDKIQKAGLKLNDKCVFAQEQVKFLGFIVNGDGIQPDPDKVKAIVEMKAPTNVPSLRCFLGMVNQLGKFSSKLSEISKPLRDLLSKVNSWIWGPAQRKAFQLIKEECQSPKILALYDPNRETLVSADSSNYGLGAVLKQKTFTGEWKPVAFASRSLNETEQRYAQVEKEALAVTWACEKFQNFLVGLKFIIHTDHKPLISLLGKKNLYDLPPRIQRFRMRLFRFLYDIQHIPGKSLVIADTLSRAPLDGIGELDCKMQGDDDIYVNSVMEGFPATEERLDQIRCALQEDPVCKQVMQFCKKGWPEQSYISEAIQPYYAVRNELSVQNNLLLRGTRLVIPHVLRLDILNYIHSGHLGISKCRERARTSVWWPLLNRQVEELCKSCSKCVELAANRAEPLLPSIMPERPWMKVGSDIFELNGCKYLLVIDYFSRWIEIAKLTGLTSNAVINHLKSIFSKYGLPEVFISDNGPQYSSTEFAQFMRNYLITHVTSSPRYPQANGAAERAVQTVKRMMRKTSDPYMAMLTYRTTPLHNGYSPSELLMGRKLRTLLPVLPELLKPDWANLSDVKETELALKAKQKTDFDRRHGVIELPNLDVGDNVRINDGYLNDSGTVISKASTPRSYNVETPHGIVRRNRRHLVNIKKPIDFGVATENNTSVNNDSTVKDNLNQDPTISNNGNQVRRSGRISRPPDRLNL